MRHTIIYHGRYSLNFDRLQTCKDNPPDFKGLDEENNTWEIDAPSRNVNGIVFGYMEKGKAQLPDSERFFAIRVENVVLDNPVKLERDVHTDGKGFGPKSSQFGDESANRLLNDIIKANPQQKAALINIHNRFFSSKNQATV